MSDPVNETCIYCHLPIHDDGIVLIDSTGGDACGVPLDNGAEHGHCRGFSPDAGGDDPDICNECLCHKLDHPRSRNEDA